MMPHVTSGSSFANRSKILTCNLTGINSLHETRLT
jgi:hypothetical protein